MFLLHGQRRYWSTVPCLFWLLLSHLCLSRPKPSLNWGLCILLFMYVYVVREYMWEGKIWGQSLYIWFQIFSGKRFDLATCSVQKQLSRSSQMAPRLAMCEIVWQMKAWSSWLERSTLNINSTNHQSAINKKQAVWCQLWMHCTALHWIHSTAPNSKY